MSFAANRPMSRRGERTGDILKRILAIIDIMAPYRHGVRADDLYGQVVERHVQVAKSTIYRDLTALHDLGFVEKLRQSDSIKLTYLYRLDINRTKRLQQMAMSFDPVEGQGVEG